MNIYIVVLKGNFERKRKFFLPLYLTLPLRVSPLEFCNAGWRQMTDVNLKCMTVRITIFTQHNTRIGQTNKQTDGRTDRMMHPYRAFRELRGAIIKCPECHSCVGIWTTALYGDVCTTTRLCYRWPFVQSHAGHRSEMLLHLVDVIKNLYIRHKSTVAFFSKIVTSAGLRAEQFGARPRKPIVTSARCAGSLACR